MKTTISLSAVACMLCGLSSVYGQSATVQQPVFRNFSVGTTVSVPDRGSVHLGSVSRAVSGTKNVGFYRPNSTVATFHEHAGASTHVYIHDFEAMDQYLLNQRNSKFEFCREYSNRGAAPAYSSLFNRNSTRKTYSRDAKPTLSRASKASRSLQLAERAEKQGKLSLARLHYRIAAKHGSNAASSRLSELAKKKENRVTKRN